MRLIQKKLAIKILLATIGMALMGFLVISYNLRGFSLDTARTQAQMATDIAGALLREQVENGAGAHSKWFNQLKGTLNIVDVHLVRSDALIREYGRGAGGLRAPTILEQRVLQRGVAEESLEENEKIIFSYAVPFTASGKGRVNCLKCHQVDEGTVLGVMQVQLDLTPVRSAALKHAALLTLLLVLGGGAFLWFLLHIIKPVLSTVQEMGGLVAMAKEGDFSGRLTSRNDHDALSMVASHINSLMETLESSLQNIASRVDALTPHATIPVEGSQLDKTIHVVDVLADAIAFKQAIEDDYNIGEVYMRLTETLRSRFSINRFSIYEADEEIRGLRAIAVEHPPEGQEFWCDARIMNNNRMCRACRTASVVDSLSSPGICSYFRPGEHSDFRHVCFPVMQQGSVGGVWQLIFSREEQDKAGGVLPAIQAILSEASPVIESKRLMQSLQASMMKDPMTGLFNRRFLEEFLVNISSGADRRNTSIGILMCDVDHFKSVNDTYGHDVGDRLLVDVAEILKKTARSSDLVFRLGGEEFMVALVDADEEKVVDVSERLRKRIENYEFSSPDGVMKKTISIGVAIYSLHSDDFTECMKFADIALYEAKNGGRNRVCVYDEKKAKMMPDVRAEC